MNIVINLEYRATNGRGKHEGEASSCPSTPSGTRCGTNIASALYSIAVTSLEEDATITELHHDPVGYQESHMALAL